MHGTFSINSDKKAVFTIISLIHFIYMKSIKEIIVNTACYENYAEFLTAIAIITIGIRNIFSHNK